MRGASVAPLSTLRLRHTALAVCILTSGRRARAKMRTEVALPSRALLAFTRASNRRRTSCRPRRGRRRPPLLLLRRLPQLRAMAASAAVVARYSRRGARTRATRGARLRRARHPSRDELCASRRSRSKVRVGPSRLPRFEGRPPIRRRGEVRKARSVSRHRNDATAVARVSRCVPGEWCAARRRRNSVRARSRVSDTRHRPPSLHSSPNLFHRLSPRLLPSFPPLRCLALYCAFSFRSKPEALVTATRQGVRIETDRDGQSCGYRVNPGIPTLAGSGVGRVWVGLEIDVQNDVVHPLQ